MTKQKIEIKNYRELNEFLNSRLSIFPTKTLRLKETITTASTFLKDKTKELIDMFEDLELSGKKDITALSEHAGPYWNSLQKIQNSLSADKFKDFLKDGLSFDAVAIDNLVAQLTEQNTYVDYIQTLYTTVKNSGFSPLVVKNARESELGYQAIFKKTTAVNDSPFAILLNGLEQYRTAENAEFFAKLELYIESGHAAQDYAKASKRKGTGIRHDTIQALFNLIKEQENPQNKNTKFNNLRDVFDARFDEIFTNVKITGSLDNREAVIVGKGSNKASNGTAAARMVDAFIIDERDSSLAHAVVVTSTNATFKKEGEQVITYLTALLKAISENKLSTVKRINLSFVMPSLLSDLNDIEGKKGGRGRKLQEVFDTSGLSAEDVESFNLMPILAGLMTNVDTSLFPDINIKLIGGTINEWNLKKQTKNSIDDVETRIAENTARVLKVLSMSKESINISADNKPGLLLDALTQITSTIHMSFKSENWINIIDGKLITDALKGLNTLGGPTKTYAQPLKASLSYLRACRDELVVEKINVSMEV